ncbi:MAG: GNAT family N-acetyltransferase [Candidatus Hermodarchaeia archaeon]|jgi:amino-acid N-acetyltransferase
MVELPVEGVKDYFNAFLILDKPSDAPHVVSAPIIGCVGIEQYKTSALLRSLAIHPDYQKQGLGTFLTKAMISQAKKQKVRALFLLTDSAVKFFEKFGFQKIDREQAIDDVKQSIEFTTLCATASLMRKNL